MAGLLKNMSPNWRFLLLLSLRPLFLLLLRKFICLKLCLVRLGRGISLFDVFIILYAIVWYYYHYAYLFDLIGNKVKVNKIINPPPICNPNPPNNPNSTPS